MNFTTYIPLQPRRISTLILVVACLPLALGCSQTVHLASTPNLYLNSKSNDPFVNVPQAWRTPEVNMLYATDRNVVATDKPGITAYGYDRSSSLAYGTCTVTMGKSLTWEGLVRDSRSDKRENKIPLAVTRIEPTGQFPKSDLPLMEVDGRLFEDPQKIADEERASADLQRLLSEMLRHAERKEVFIFVHGYNNTFDSATFRIAQLWHFRGRQGVPVAYSWPAGAPGLLRGYTRDRESSEFTVFHLKQFLRALAGCPELQKIHIIAHSRGTDVASTALRELHLEY